MEDKYIKIWDYEDAPEEYKKLSNHGGDEDYLAYLPKYCADKRRLGYYYTFLDEGTRFGCCDVSEHYLDDGSLILIGAHS